MGTTFEDTIIQLYDAKGKQQTRYFFHVMKKKNSSPIYVNNFHNTTTKKPLKCFGVLTCISIPKNDHLFARFNINRKVIVSRCRL